jgi:carbonic anhydrase
MSMEPQTFGLSSDRPSPQEALDLMLAGNKRYLTGNVTPENYAPRHTASALEHKPVAAILGCGDARVGAELVFDKGPGDLFMVRVAGNFLSDYGLASLEFAVEILNVPLLMVLGHTHCGAVTSAVKVVTENIDLPGRMFVLIDALEPSVLHARLRNADDLINATIEENVHRQVRRLRTISPVICKALDAGEVEIVGAIYDIETGVVRMVDRGKLAESPESNSQDSGLT